MNGNQPDHPLVDQTSSIPLPIDVAIDITIKTINFLALREYINPKASPLSTLNLAATAAYLEELTTKSLLP